MGFLMPFFAVLYCRIAMFARFLRVLARLLVVVGFMMGRRGVMMFGSFMMPLGSVHVML
jgi:hypothetical protein